jgi:autotransporter-associated beta strand protein
MEVYSLTFSGSYPTYSFTSYGESSLRVGAGGISAGSRETDFAAFDLLQLTANQTWSVGSDGLLSVDRVTGSYNLTKTGTGTLALGNSTFGSSESAVGLDVQAGTLWVNFDYVTYSEQVSLGIGQIKLRSGTFIAGDYYSVSLANAVLLETGVTFGASWTDSLRLKGTTTLQSSSTTITVQGDAPTYFDGGIAQANSNTSLTIRGSQPAFLTGTNTYTGATIADGGLVIFGNSGAFTATSGVNAINNGYAGVSYTDSGAMAALIAKTAPASYTGTIGFDSTSETPTFTDDVNLSGFDSSKLVGLGTSTSARLAGTLTPPSGGPLSLVALNDGRLTVASILSSNTAVSIGYPTDSSTISYNGTVQIESASNTYTGGTTLKSGALVLGGSSTINGSGAITEGPIGTGSLIVPSNANNATLVPAVNELTLHNNIVLQGSSTLGVGADVDSRIGGYGFNGITLAGNISGTGGLQTVGSYSTLTLNGTNTFSGGITVSSGTLIIASDAALASSTLHANGGFVEFNSPNPVIGGLDGSGLIYVNEGTSLQINQQGSSEFSGSIGGSNVSINKTGSGTLTVTGCRTLSGTVTISQGTLIVNGGSESFGKDVLGPLGGASISLNGGQLKLAEGSSLLNSITASAPSRISGTGTIKAAFTAGTNLTLAPGSSPGTMTFTSNLTFASGGSYELEMQSASGSPGTGFDTLNIGGILNFSTPTTAFKIDLISLSTSGAAGNVADFSATTSYSWQIAYAAGGITDFTGANYTINTSGFTNSANGIFSLSVSSVRDGAALFLNFTPIPEPSTWMLLGGGVAMVGLTTLRRRRRARR